MWICEGDFFGKGSFNMASILLFVCNTESGVMEFCHEHLPNVFVVTEHAFLNYAINCFYIEGYSIINNFSTSIQKVGGVAHITRIGDIGEPFILFDFLSSVAFWVDRV